MSCIKCNKKSLNEKYGICIDCVCDLIENEEMFNSEDILRMVNEEYNTTRNILIFLTLLCLIINILFLSAMLDGADLSIVTIIVISIAITAFWFVKAIDYIKYKKNKKNNIRRKILSGGKVGCLSIFQIMDIVEKMQQNFNEELQKASKEKLNILAQMYNIKDYTIVKDYITYNSYLKDIIKKETSNINKTKKEEEELRLYYAMQGDLSHFYEEYSRYEKNMYTTIWHYYVNKDLQKCPEDYITDEGECTKYYNSIKFKREQIKILPYGNVKLLLKMEIPLIKKLKRDTFLDGYIKVNLYENDEQVGEGILTTSIEEIRITETNKYERYVKGFNNDEKYEVIIKVNKKIQGDINKLKVEFEPIKIWICIK